MIDFADIWGQESAKRALIVAMAGDLSLLLIGPPGCGKSMLRAAAQAIKPESTFGETRDPLEYCKDGGYWQMHVEVPRVPFRALGCTRGTSSDQVREQLKRMGNGGTGLTPDALRLLKQGYEEIPLSAQGYTHVLAVARAISRLEAASQIEIQHIAEALQYRLLERAGAQ